MLQVAKNFWQLEKAKAIMQQAYVPRTSKLHKHIDTPKSEQKWGQDQSIRQRKADTCKYWVGLHTRALYALLQRSDALRSAVRESDIFPVHVIWEHLL